MGNLLHYTIKILSLAAQAVIVSLNTQPAQGPAIAKIPDPILSQPVCETGDPEIQCFETSHGTVYLFKSSRDIWL